MPRAKIRLVQTLERREGDQWRLYKFTDIHDVRTLAAYNGVRERDGSLAHAVQVPDGARFVTWIAIGDVRVIVPTANRDGQCLASLDYCNDLNRTTFLRPRRKAKKAAPRRAGSGRPRLRRGAARSRRPG